MGCEEDGPATEKLLKLQVEFWTKRLDHTLQHTQTSTRQIYLVDGAVLAFLYFIVSAVGVGRQVVLFISVPVLLLAVLNWLHAELISSQGSWYSGIGKRLQALLQETAPIGHTRLPGKLQPTGTHSTYRAIHLFIALALLALGVLLLAYGLGAGQELVLLETANRAG